MSILHQITEIHCVLLDKRIHFWPEIQKSFNDNGLRINPFIVGDGQTMPKASYKCIDENVTPPLYLTTNYYESWVNRPNAFNAYMSHYKILEEAMKRGLPNVMIVEDDVKIEDDFHEIIAKTGDFFEKNRWDLVYFGAFHKGTQQITENIVKTTGQSGGWHAILINASLFPLLLSFLPIGPFDWICEKFIQSKYDCYGIYPCVISQKDNVFSIVENSNLEKPSRFAL